MLCYVMLGAACNVVGNGLAAPTKRFTGICKSTMNLKCFDGKVRGFTVNDHVLDRLVMLGKCDVAV
jgi:hypothetical protein